MGTPGSWRWALAVPGAALTVFGFAGSSFSREVAVMGAVGSVLLALWTARRFVSGGFVSGGTWRGLGILTLAQGLYLVLWIGGGLLWFGARPAGQLPLFAERLDLNALQGRWRREDGRVYTLRGLRLCPEAGGVAHRDGVRQADSAPDLPADTCFPLMQEADGRLSLLTDDVMLLLRAYRRWGRESLETGMFDLNFARPASRR